MRSLRTSDIGCVKAGISARRRQKTRRGGGEPQAARALRVPPPAKPYERTGAQSGGTVRELVSAPGEGAREGGSGGRRAGGETRDPADHCQGQRPLKRA